MSFCLRTGSAWACANSGLGVRSGKQGVATVGGFGDALLSWVGGGAAVGGCR